MTSKWALLRFGKVLLCINWGMAPRTLLPRKGQEVMEEPRQLFTTLTCNCPPLLCLSSSHYVSHLNAFPQIPQQYYLSPAETKPQLQQWNSGPADNIIHMCNIIHYHHTWRFYTSTWTPPPPQVARLWTSWSSLSVQLKQHVDGPTHTF